MEETNESFSYTYSAKQQQEVERIRRKYVPPEENRLEQLRRLDESADRPGRLISLIAGVIGTLAFGVGMCCTMVWTDYFALGVLIGSIGLAGVGSAYPVYAALTKRQRKKLAPEIIRLTSELMAHE